MRREKPSYRRWAFLLAVVGVAVIGVAGCSEPAGEVEAELAVGTVAGTVTQHGSPAPGAVVAARVRRTCYTADFLQIDQPYVTANSDGVYVYRMRSAIASDSACVRLVAYRNSAMTSDSAVADGLELRFGGTGGAGQRPDSIRVDLALP